MKIACPSCDTKYSLSAEALGDSGRKMKCAKCAHIWQATVKDAIIDKPIAQTPVADTTPMPAYPEPTAPEIQAAVSAAMQAAEADGKLADEQQIDNWNSDLNEDLESIINTQKTAKEAKPEKKTTSSVEKLDGFKVRLNIMKELAGEQAALAYSTLIKGFFWVKNLNIREQIAVCVGLAMPFFIMGGLLAGRESLVRTFPDLASLYATLGVEVNLRGLLFEDVRTVRRPENGVAILVVEGTIRNVSTQTKSVPTIQFILSGRDREVYAWQDNAEQQTLNVGEMAQFRTVLASPPDVADELHVRFFNENPNLNHL